MKKLLLIILNLGLAWPILLSQQSKAWDYPIRPGCEEWEKVKTFEEKVNLYNVPSDLLKIMKTEDLIKTCLNYPELRLIFSRNNTYEGFEFLKENFNGFRELEVRSDAGKLLLSIYTQKKHADVTFFSKNIDKGTFMANILYLEIFISQDRIINSLSNTERIALKTRAIKSFESILTLKDIYGTFPLEYPALIMGRVLKIETETNPILKQSIDDEISTFLIRPQGKNSSVWYKIYELAKNTL